MATATVTPNQETVESEIQIAAPPERVFQALTDAAQLRQWFPPVLPGPPVGDGRPPGGRYSYTTEKGTVVVNNVSEFECHGEILEYEPPRLLVYTWIGDCTKTRLASRPSAGISRRKPAATHVKVTHSGLAQEPTARKDYSGGWPGVVQQLKKFIEK